ncbi:hypothetical protein [Ammoniphilus sp. 3BR4]|uniref:hypothetical protein n=1 Tax=Ammoniphilus sp. 3BR4 TaxID=3158265 RepID=UPI00346578AF
MDKNNLQLKSIEKLIQLEKELKQQGLSLDRNLSLIIENQTFRYETTPYDVITFASTGGDGIHFGFLTDFGTVKNLEETYIVCVSPMRYPQHIKVVARNIREFIAVVCTLKSAMVIENFTFFTEEKQYQKLIDDWDEISSEFKLNALYVSDRLKQEFGVQELSNLYTYVDGVLTERANRTILPTLDGIGIVSISKQSDSHKVFPLSKDVIPSYQDVLDFFEGATLESKLAFIRDSQYTLLIDSDYDMRELVIEEMLKIGLHDEVDKLTEY